MTKGTVAARNRDVADYLEQTTLSDSQNPEPEEQQRASKSPTDSAMLALELASETSWADRYLPSASSAAVMTPSASSVTGNTEAATSSTDEQSYVTPDEAPPTYESVTGDSEPRELDGRSWAPTAPFSHPQPHILVPTFSQPQPHIHLPAFSQPQPHIHVPTFSQPQPHIHVPTFSQPRPHELIAPFSQPQSHDLVSEQPSQARPWLPNRRYSRHETSSSISGDFTVHDELDLSTTSGSIRVKLDIKPGTQPALIKLKTKSGSLSVEDKQCDLAQSWRHASRNDCGRSQRHPAGPGPLSFLFGWAKKLTDVPPPPPPETDDPRKQAGQIVVQEPVPAAEVEEVEEERFTARPVHITIETSSGSANVHLTLTPGSDTSVKTSSGSIVLRMVTADSSLSSQRTLSKLELEDSRNANRPAADFGSKLSLTSGSGSQNVHINTGIADTSDGAIISACRASHYVTGSGSQGIYYPKEWQGLVHANSGGSGSINVRGQGLEYDNRGNKEVYAWRGVEQPDLGQAVEIRCDGSGSVTFQC